MRAFHESPDRKYTDLTCIKVSKDAKIRNRYNQVSHLSQDTNGKVTNSQFTPQTRAKRSALKRISQKVEYFCCRLTHFEASLTNRIDPDQTAPIGAI